MNYIYDILVNFNEVLYDFYDWNPNDNIINIRKVPLFKVEHQFLKDLKENALRFEDSFLAKIQGKTEIFSNKDIKRLEYVCLFSDGLEVIAMQLKNNGIKKSKLLVDEEIEVLEVVNRLKEETIPYQILKRSKIAGFKTRKELDMEKMIRSGLKKLVEEKDLEKLKYIYYECFNQKEENMNQIVDQFYQSLESNTDSIATKLYEFLKLTQVHK